MTPDNAVIQKAKKIKFLLLDLDGVLTDGRIVYDSKGRDSKFFNVHDGLGVYLLREYAGIKTIIITAKNSKAIKPRARDMKIEAVYADIKPKTKVYDHILAKYCLKDEEICFVGDDLVDLGILKRAGLAIAVPNAADEVQEIAHYITQRSGGQGAVREIAEIILKSQGCWEEIICKYSV